MPLEAFSPRQFHASYKPELALDEVDFSPRAQALFARINLSTVGDLLLAKGSDLTENTNFGLITLQRTREIVHQLILRRSAIDLSSFDMLVRTFTATVLQDPRDIEIFLQRLGIPNGRRYTLSKIAETCGLSRERVRQICDSTTERLALASNLSQLEEFYAAIADAVRDAHGTLRLGALAARLQHIFAWDNPPDLNCLEYLIRLSKQFELRQDLLRLVSPMTST
ncbi:MAG: sigma factor-like helix-turn-helix DNA-binding protein [Planctomycetota bacterium]